MKSSWLLLAFASAAVLTLTSLPPSAATLSPAAVGLSFRDAKIIQEARFGHRRHHGRHHRGLRYYGYGLPFIAFGGHRHRHHGGFGFGGFGHHGGHHGGLGHRSHHGHH